MNRSAPVACEMCSDWRASGYACCPAHEPGCAGGVVRFSRAWAMPNASTFSISPIAELLARVVVGVSVDPFCGDSLIATHRNDLRTGVDAEVFCRSLVARGVVADTVLFDPPYSPRQIAEVYRSVGLPVGMEETQNGKLYGRVRSALNPLLKPGGVAVSFGWNSAGFGKGRGFVIEEIMLVAHGGAHNDTIVVVERKKEFA